MPISGVAKVNTTKRIASAQSHSKLRIFAKSLATVKLPCLVDIGNCGNYKEDSDIEPIGRATDCSVIGIEDYRYENNAEYYSLKLHAPKN